ncbi:MAG: biotin--[acetyl-CoA-carboxylase] ligase [Lachnospiraceae bacterium]|nr:biotin--[acetyl-CoA-carboxylase] ligase [Lachnospiraceae bacterium]
MSVKQDVLKTLELHKGESISGAQLAKELNVSRNAVWKAINALKEAGYPIASVTGKGYQLSQTSHILSRESINALLPKELPIMVEECVSSTNRELMKLAEDGAPNGTVLIAKEQTQGRGHDGHDFYSPKGTGIYLSILIRSEQLLASPRFFTIAAAVATAKAIESTVGKPVDIKWVNDLFMNGKKVCGILTEGAMDMERGDFRYIVVGIGINFCAPKDGFPGDLNQIATGIFSNEKEACDKEIPCIANLLTQFMSLYDCMKNDDYSFTNEYVKRTLVKGATHIDHNGYLHYTDVTGTNKLLRSSRDLTLSK